MMLCNVLVPILEHGLRQDWRSVLPAATVLSSSSKWTQSLVKQARGAQPTAFDVLEVEPSASALLPMFSTCGLITGSIRNVAFRADT